MIDQIHRVEPEFLDNTIIIRFTRDSDFQNVSLKYLCLPIVTVDECKNNFVYSQHSSSAVAFIRGSSQCLHYKIYRQIKYNKHL